MGATKPLEDLIEQRLQPRDAASEAFILSLIRHWLFENDRLFFLNMNANDHAYFMLRNAIDKINAHEKNAAYEADKEKIIKDILSEEFKKNKLLETMATAVPVDNEKSAEDEVDALLAYVPGTLTIDPKEQDEQNKRKNEQNTRTALSQSDAAQNLASFAGGLASASIQESADFAARAATMPGSALIALRHPLPPSIATGAHIASLVADGLNLIIFPILLLRAYLRGEKISLSKDDIGRLSKSAVTLSLAIAGLIVAPAIAIPLMIASSAFAAATVLVGLGNFLFDRYKLNKNIETKRDALITLTAKIKQLQMDAKNQRKLLAEQMKQEAPNQMAINGIQQELRRINGEYARAASDQTTQRQSLNTLTQRREREGTVRQILPRSLGFAVAATIMIGAVLLIVPPLAPIGISIIIGGAAAGIALMAGVFTSHFILSRKGKEKAAEKNAIQLKEQHAELKTHETTATLAKQLGIANSELSHQGRVREIAGRLEKIKAQIQDPKDSELGKKALIKFFVTYCQVHQDDSTSTLKAQPIFNEIRDRSLVDYTFNALKLIVNVDKGEAITPDDLNILKAFDKKHDFFHEHGIGIEFVSKTEPEKPQPSAGASREFNKRSPRTP